LLSRRCGEKQIKISFWVAVESVVAAVAVDPVVAAAADTDIVDKE
jgi:hypothetical protein